MESELFSLNQTLKYDCLLLYLKINNGLNDNILNSSNVNKQIGSG